jgi:menaquinone-specific isochorismate synthase
VEALDPLAVLEQIFDPREPHFYAEQPAVESALAGAEVAASVEADGPDRFAQVQRWAEALLDGATAVGDVKAPFGGPHISRASLCGASRTGRTVSSGLCVRAALAGGAGRQHHDSRGSIFSSLPTRISSPPRRGSGGRTRNSGHSDLANRRRLGRTKWDGGFATQEVGDYAAAVSGALASIARGECQKIVLARAKDVTARRQLHPLRVLNGFRQRFPECHAFSFTRGGARVSSEPARNDWSG